MDELAGQSDAHKNGGGTAGRLMTFKAPTPSYGLINFLVPVNRWLNLGGIPGLRSVPLVGRIPGIRGLVDIPVIDFPEADEQRLIAAVSPQNACFITPNHPEFFTDWMLDKEIMGRMAPKTASWATHGVVNGMGEFGQKFWLKNNLIAQIPGVGGKAGKAYSIDWALKGHNVLLHPEGGVGWHNDLISPLFPGAVDMALEAAGHMDAQRATMVAPVVWKLKFNRDVEADLHRELDYVEKSLKLSKSPSKSSSGDNPAARLYHVYSSLLARDERRYGIAPSKLGFFERQNRLIEKICDELGGHCDRLKIEGAGPASGEDFTERDVKNLIRQSERWLRAALEKTATTKSVRTLINDLRQLQRMHAGIYGSAPMTQEHVAESIKRIRNDYCKGTLRDSINKFVPQPVGPRTAHIRVPEPLDVGALMTRMSSTEMVRLLEERMQSALDEINDELRTQGKLISYDNPFKV